MADLWYWGPQSPERNEVVALLRGDGHTVVVLPRTAHRLPAVSRRAEKILFVDLAGGPDAFRFIRSVRSHHPGTLIIAIAVPGEGSRTATALSLGALEIVARPVSGSDLRAALGNLVELAGLAQRDARSPVLRPDVLHDLPGESAAAERVRQTARRAARTRCGILVTGENGSEWTGDIIARGIHAQSQRASGPFVTIDCASTPASDLKKDLFRDVVATVPVKKPRAAGSLGPCFKRSAGGTLYLRNIGDLPLPLQKHLDRRVADFASAPLRSLDVRIVAAGMQDLDLAVHRGLFLRSLFDRLAVVRIDVPPLRERAEDIPQLAALFMTEACTRNAVSPKAFTGAASRLLSALPWSGNVRELRALVERLAVLVPKGVVLQEDVLEQLRLDDAELKPRKAQTLREARERFERDYVMAVIKQHRGRMGSAARHLGIERTNLYRKIAQLGIRVGTRTKARGVDRRQ